MKIGISNFERKLVKNLVNRQHLLFTLRHGDIQSLAAVYAKFVEKNTLEPL
jgi:hypothetical protein